MKILQSKFEFKQTQNRLMIELKLIKESSASTYMPMHGSSKRLES